jgi:hypothetical protein
VLFGASALEVFSLTEQGFNTESTEGAEVTEKTTRIVFTNPLGNEG